MTGGPRTPLHRLDRRPTDDPASTPTSTPADGPAEGVGVGHGGVVIGFRPDGEPVAVQLFRNRPTHVVTVCSGFTARLLAFRALAVGATIEVATGAATSAAGWSALLDAAPDGSAVTARPGDPMPGATARRPRLRCEGVPPEAATPWPGLAAWQTRVVVPSSVPPSTVAGLTAFDLVLLRRLPPDAIYPVQLAFNLPTPVAEKLRRLPNDGLVAIADGRALVLSLGLTAIELSVLGAPTA